MDLAPLAVLAGLLLWGSTGTFTAATRFAVQSAVEAEAIEMSATPTLEQPTQEGTG